MHFVHDCAMQAVLCMCAESCSEHACKSVEQIVHLHASLRGIASFCWAFLHRQPAFALQHHAQSLGGLSLLAAIQYGVLIFLVTFLQHTT